MSNLIEPPPYQGRPNFISLPTRTDWQDARARRYVILGFAPWLISFTTGLVSPHDKLRSTPVVGVLGALLLTAFVLSFVVSPLRRGFVLGFVFLVVFGLIVDLLGIAGNS